MFTPPGDFFDGLLGPPGPGAGVGGPARCPAALAITPAPQWLHYLLKCSSARGLNNFVSLFIRVFWFPWLEVIARSRVPSPLETVAPLRGPVMKFREP